MRIKFMIFAMILLLSNICIGQNRNNLIKNIRSTVQAIDSQLLTSKIYEYNDHCGVISASITIYYDEQNNVKKITDVGQGDNHLAAGSWSYQYYYENNYLIFSYETITGFNEESDKSETSVTREYFSKNEMIKSIINNNTTFPKNKFIGSDDIRYSLREVRSKSDIDIIYKCEYSP